MLWATNAALQSLGEEALVSFDTVLTNTNDNASVEDDMIYISKPGWYVVSLRCVTVNASESAAIQAGVRLLANELPVDGSEAKWKVPISGAVPAYVSVPVRVIPAENGVATLSWQVTDQVNLRDVMLTVERKI